MKKSKDTRNLIFCGIDLKIPYYDKSWRVSVKTSLLINFPFSPPPNILKKGPPRNGAEIIIRGSMAFTLNGGRSDHQIFGIKLLKMVILVGNDYRSLSRRRLLRYSSLLFIAAFSRLIYKASRMSNVFKFRLVESSIVVLVIGSKLSPQSSIWKKY